jgi:O-glycosyl hydrolase
MKIASDMEAAIQKYLAHVKADYAGWHRPRGNDHIRDEMVREFDKGISYEIHRKFIKVITGQAGGNTSVHSFIVLADDGKFKRGDILMAASWKAPAKNFARGNVLSGKLDRVRWTGAL